MLTPEILIGVAVLVGIVLFMLMRPSFLNRTKFSSEGKAMREAILINSLQIDEEATNKDTFENRITDQVLSNSDRLDDLYVERKYKGAYGISTRKSNKTSGLPAEQDVIAKPSQVKPGEPVVVKSEQIKPNEAVAVKSEQVEPVQNVVAKGSAIIPGEQVVVKTAQVKPNEVVITKPKNGKPSQPVLKEDVSPTEDVIVNSNQVEPAANVTVKASQVMPGAQVVTKSQNLKSNENVVAAPAQVKPVENVVVKVKQTETTDNVMPVDNADTGLINSPTVETYRVDYLGSRSNMDGPFSMNRSGMNKGYGQIRKSQFTPNTNLVYNRYSVHHAAAGF